MFKRFIATLAFLVFALCSQAQTAVTAAGGRADNSGCTLTYSVGQIAVAATQDGRLREGVVQPYTVEEVGITENAEVSSALTVYPNPTLDGVTMRRDDAVARTTVQLYSLDGRLIRTEEWVGEILRLDLGSLAAGVYMLKADGRTYKITKQ